jgi:murein DD-endopeptidase MepM/ murein hydrolase activator NlpD
MIRGAGKTGWAVITEGIGDDPNDHSGGDYTWLQAYGVTPIVRLNYSHHGEGTIPKQDRYNQFAQRCANFVTASPGCQHWIIGNEPNLAGERPDGLPILPHNYADCYRLCRQAIKQRGQQHLVIIAAMAPYNVDTGWCMDYWYDVLEILNPEVDGLALHTYSRGPNPESIFWEDKMDAPYQNFYNGFKAYRDFLALVPGGMRNLPVYITETDQNTPWANTNSGWVKNAYQEINAWNQRTGVQKISALTLYRWEEHDKWGIKNKSGVHDDFRDALKKDYLVPDPGQPVIPNPPVSPAPPDPVLPIKDRDFDPALIARGVEISTPSLADNEKYWFADHLEWLDLQESGGRHHIYGNVYNESGQELFGVRLKVSWPTGDTLIETKKDPVSPYAYNYPMSRSLNEFRIEILGGTTKSELVSGIGMGFQGNPAEHTSTVVKWKLKTHHALITPPKPVDPVPPKPVPGTPIVHPLPGATVSQHWGQNAESYAKFGMWGHNGTDLAGVVSGRSIVSFAEGTVAFVGNDAAGYGNYARVYHPKLACYSFYAHMKSLDVTVGQAVIAGSKLGVIGYTGNVSPPGPAGEHLHFEIRLCDETGAYLAGTPQNNGRVDPETFCILRGLRLGR